MIVIKYHNASIRLQMTLSIEEHFASQFLSLFFLSGHAQKVRCIYLEKVFGNKMATILFIPVIVMLLVCAFLLSCFQFLAALHVWTFISAKVKRAKSWATML